MSTKDKVEQYIKEHKVFIASKSYCPFCKRAKDLLRSLDVEFFAIELDQIPDGAEIQDILEEITKQRTVPNIFINGVHVGGCDDLFKAHDSGKLKELLGQ
uniref:ARAD1C33550p n=1 Tax=Blastobotrys adeninivorans TaxID=409370 RepID=A0A060T8Z1_BLAAD